MTSNLPRITVITPSYNQGEYLEQTIQSVLDQRYPNLEFMIFDGGSTDESPRIIERYASQLAYYEIERDRGQTHAINKGLERATGDIVAYLNSDDVYLPGALLYIGQYFAKHPKAEWVTGECLLYGDGSFMWMKPPAGYSFPKLVAQCAIAQPSTFWRRSVIERFGAFDEDRRYNMDYEYWLRLMKAGTKLHVVKYPISAFRLHEASKTVAENSPFEEADRILRDEYRTGLSPIERWIETRYRQRYQNLWYRGKRWVRNRMNRITAYGQG